MTAANNLRLTMNFSFCASGAASVRHAARQGARVTRCGSRVTSNRIRSTPNRKAVRVPVACTNGVACRGKVRITTRGKKKRNLGTSRYAVKPGTTTQVRVRLTKRGRQVIKQRKRTRARTVVTVKGAANSQRPVVLVRRK